MIEVRRLAGALLVAIGLAVAVLGVRGKTVTASPSPYAQVDVPDLALTAPQTPAHLDRSAALALIEAKLNPSLLAHPYTVEYGAFGFGDTALSLNGPSSRPQRLGTRDVWKVTITGLHIARPCAARAVPPRCPPPVSTLAVFVDDKLGQVLESEGY